MTQARRSHASIAIGNRIAPVRFLLFLALLPASFFGYQALFGPHHWADAATVAFDIAAVTFLLSLLPLARGANAEVMRAHSAANDANRELILALTALVTFAVLAAITGELAGARQGEPAAVAKLVGTLLAAWLFVNSVYALHYAHAFYLGAPKGGDEGGLEFPGTRTPDYLDFTYFAFTLGMTFQTSDVQITARPLRRVALLHGFVAFVFNIGVIAFTINALGGGG
ncbi:MAG TPA: DUF1345 domain-containing protein [Croceibacterium sp.]|nr:DUF1345 domain-containing protein [Croceibacterium sp.]